ncbi:MAG: UDP-N-acetylmuramate--L-alanine ligase [Bifidobacteriaceae bacterium]|jgi:UDP-N-acetylmuramate--alanine ligase|nr:UDP-N-acetylmuramate--L-alanine ligase [Bifidobacteriaceae bacterium]
MILKMSEICKIHFIGVGGAGMGTLAQMYLEAGYLVQGSDQTDLNNNVSVLKKLGIKVFVGHKKENIVDADIAVITSAIKDNNPELQAAKKKNIPILHRSEALAKLVNPAYLISIAGAHGKTTTAALLAHTLQELGVDCSYSFGANIIGDNRSVTGGYIGKDNIAVIEADESDGSFLNFDSDIAIILNIEPDHLDHYKTPQAFLAAFGEFAKKAKNLVLFCGDDKKTFEFLMNLDKKKLISYGAEKYNDFSLDNFSAFNDLGLDNFSTDSLSPLGKLENLPLSGNLPLLGEHNKLNSLAVFLAVKNIFNEKAVLNKKPVLNNNSEKIDNSVKIDNSEKIDDAQIIQAIKTFPGVSRRFEFKGSVKSVRLFDDYAHLPSEIEATILATRPLLRNNGKIKVLFQSHLFSRTKNFAASFAKALELSDAVIVTDVYPAREPIDPNVTPETILQHITRNMDFWSIPDRHKAAKKLGQIAQSDDILLTLGAGDLNILDKEILGAINV